MAWLRKWFPIDREDRRSPARQVAGHVASVLAWPVALVVVVYVLDHSGAGH